MISVNQVLKFNDDRLVRVLWVSEDYSRAFVIGFDDRAIPEAFSIAELERLESVNDVHSYNFDEDEIPTNYILKRNAVWDDLKKIVFIEPDIYLKNKRNKIISEAMPQSSLANKSFYKYLKRYWQRGKTINALLPDYNNCGKGSKDGDTKLAGRKPKYESNVKAIVISTKIEKIFNAVFREYNKSADRKSLRKAYDDMKTEYFREEMEKLEGVSRIPSYRQFVRRYNQNHSVDDKLKNKKGEKTYDKDHRPILGQSTREAYGPGSKYQIDATIGDVYLLSEFNRANIIGRPVIYFCIDVFSRMVAGMYVGLEGPSMAGAAMAIINCAEDKVQFCKKYGVEVSKEDWPVENLPAAFLGDNGEMKGITPENLIQLFGIKIENTGTYRADAKGIVERFFKTMNDKVKPELPGFVLPDHRQRGGSDYRLDATMTLDEFTAYLIPKIILHNRSIISGYPFDEEIEKADVMHRPKDLWAWGVMNRAGLLRSVDMDQLKACLLKHKEATVTAQGIRLHEDLHYTAPIALERSWFTRYEGRKSFKVPLAYNPRNLREAYIYFDKKYYRAYPTIESDVLKYNLEDYQYRQELIKYQIKKDERNALKDSLNEYDLSKKILNNAVQKTAETPVYESKTRRVNNIRENRKLEKEVRRHKDVVDNTAELADVISIKTKEEYNPKKAEADRLRKLRNLKLGKDD
ncbi:MAG: Mu transposase C-terminal domain-containing protein [Deferribacterales bacterium]